MAKTAISFILLCVFNVATAQNNLFKQWDRRFGNEGYDVVYDIVETGEKGFLICGSTNSNIGGDVSEFPRGLSDYWIVKIDSLGNKVWDKRFGTSEEDVIYSVVKCSSGGYLVGGISGMASDGDKSELARGGLDIWLIRIDEDGQKVWDKTLGGTASEYLGSIVDLGSNGFLVTSTSNSAISGDKTQANFDPSNLTDDYWILKLDAAGNKVWDKVFGGVFEDALTQGLTLNDSIYIVSGISYSPPSGNRTTPRKNTADLWIVKIDSSGDKIGETSYGTNLMSSFNNLCKISNNSFLFSGTADVNPLNPGDISQPNTASGLQDYWIINIKGDLTKGWDKLYGGADNEEAPSVFHCNDKGLLISGNSYSNLPGGVKSEGNNGVEFLTWIVKTDSLGNKLWDKTILTNRRNSGKAIQCSDGCYVIAAFTDSYSGGLVTEDSLGKWDYWAVKFCEAPVNILESAINNVSVHTYPNPFTEEISIAIFKENLSEAEFTISDIEGHIVYSRDEKHLSDTYTKMLDLANLSKGIYFVKVTVGEEIIVKQIVKQ